MAYRIEYNEGAAKKLTVYQTKSGKSRTAVIVIVLIIFGFITLYGLGRDHLREVLVPGDPAVTEAAAVKFVDEIQHGTSIINAFGVFCREIIEGAKIQNIY